MERRSPEVKAVAFGVGEPLDAFMACEDDMLAAFPDIGKAHQDGLPLLLNSLIPATKANVFNSRLACLLRDLSKNQLFEPVDSVNDDRLIWCSVELQQDAVKLRNAPNHIGRITIDVSDAVFEIEKQRRRPLRRKARLADTILTVNQNPPWSRLSPLINFDCHVSPQ